MRVNKGAYYGASVDRSHIPRRLGGKGITSFKEMYETAVVRAASYLLNNKDDVVIEEVFNHKILVDIFGGWSV